MSNWIYFNGYMFNKSHIVYKKKTDFQIEIGTITVTVKKNFDDEDACNDDNDELNAELGI